MNNFIITGRLKAFNEKEKDTKIIVEVARTFKNEKGIYESDLLPIILKGSIATHTKEYCNINDFVGIKGRVESNGSQMNLIAEKIALF